MVLLPSNTEADLNSYDRENICVPEYFCTSKYRRYGDLFVWDTIARVCIFIYLFSWGEYECCLCLDAAEVNINNATELSRPSIFFTWTRWIHVKFTFIFSVILIKQTNWRKLATYCSIMKCTNIPSFHNFQRLNYLNTVRRLICWRNEIKMYLYVTIKA